MNATNETRSPWQIEQGKKCSCRGSDDYCPCQNVDFGTRDKALSALTSAPQVEESK